jgi:hypothetical protein
MKNVSFSGNMAGYMESKPEKKVDIDSKKQKEIIALSTSDLVSRCDELINSVSESYGNISHKELYDATIMLQGAKRCLLLVNPN